MVNIFLEFSVDSGRTFEVFRDKLLIHKYKDDRKEQ